MEEQFRTLYEENYNNLCKAAYRILKEKDTAREIVQEIFVELWNKEGWHLLESPKGYLYMAVYNRCLNWIKKRKRFVSDEMMPEARYHENNMLEEEELQQNIDRRYKCFA